MKGCQRNQAAFLPFEPFLWLAAPVAERRRSPGGVAEARLLSEVEARWLSGVEARLLSEVETRWRSRSPVAERLVLSKVEVSRSSGLIFKNINVYA